MNIESNRENNILTVAVEGRMDTVTAPQLDEFITENTEGVSELILDLKGLSYTSSTGLRVLLKAQKMMNKQGSMKLINVQDSVMEILEITGFTDIITIE
jgi:anti-sigma B factor antagonist